LKIINTALIGCWHVHARDYANQLRNNPNTQLCCVWDEKAEWGQKIASEYDVPFVSTLDEVLNDKSIDAVVISTATSAHTDIMIKCANAGKHIFTEKVLTLTLKDALAVKDAIAKNNVKFCISYPHRVMAHNVRAKEILDSGLLGDVSYMRVRNAHNGATADWLPDHFYNLPETGGGAMVDLGAHPMYLCLWLMGRPKAVRSTFTSFSPKGLDDNDVSVLEYANGAIAVSETGFVTGNDPFVLEMSGTKGHLHITNRKLKYYDSEAKAWVTPSLPGDQLSPMVQWSNDILGTGTCEFGIDDAVALTELMEAAYVSYHENRTVNL